MGGQKKTRVSERQEGHHNIVIIDAYSSSHGIQHSVARQAADGACQKGSSRAVQETFPSIPPSSYQFADRPSMYPGQNRGPREQNYGRKKKKGKLGSRDLTSKQRQVKEESYYNKYPHEKESRYILM